MSETAFLSNVRAKMKTEHKRHLETNWLADQLGKQIELVKPYGTHIAVGAAIVVALIVGYQWFSATNTATEGEAWFAYMKALNASAEPKPDDLSLVYETHKSTMAAAWAKLMLADSKLDSGNQHLFGDRFDSPPDRAKANADFAEARDLYRELLKDNQVQNSPMLMQRATLGLAQVYESRNELNKARDNYKKLLKDWPDGLYQSVAEKRLASLERESTKQFYDKLARYEPKIPEPSGPGVPGKKPEFKLPDFLNTPKEQPDTGDGETPTAPDLLPSLPSPEKDLPDKPDAGDKPAPTKNKPALDSSSEKPAENKPETKGKPPAAPDAKSKE